MQRHQQRRWRRTSDVGGEWRVVALVSRRPKEKPVCRTGRDQLVESHGEVWQGKAELRIGQRGDQLNKSCLSGVEGVPERMGGWEVEVDTALSKDSWCRGAHSLVSEGSR